MDLWLHVKLETTKFIFDWGIEGDILKHKGKKVTLNIPSGTKYKLPNNLFRVCMFSSAVNFLLRLNNFIRVMGMTAAFMTMYSMLLHEKKKKKRKYT